MKNMCYTNTKQLICFGSQAVLSISSKCGLLSVLPYINCKGTGIIYIYLFINYFSSIIICLIFLSWSSFSYPFSFHSNEFQVFFFLVFYLFKFLFFLYPFPHVMNNNLK